MNELKPNPHSESAGSNWSSLRHVQSLVLIAVTALGLYLCYRLLLPFLPAMAWAFGLAVVFGPLQRWLEAKLKRPNLAALISAAAISLGVFTLVTFVGQRLVREAVSGAKFITTKVESGEWRHALETHPRLAPLADWLEQQDLPGTIKTVATWMTTTGASFIKGSIVEILGLFLTFYLLFFFLRDRSAALQMLERMTPLSKVEMDRLCIRVRDTVFATIYGTLAVSAVQGLLGGLMFWFLGLPVPLLWGVVMGLLAVVPVLGAFVIWIPAVLFLLSEGHWVKALILAVWGMAVVGTIDNLLRPVLVGNRLKLHTVLAFISVVGGLVVFGASGLVLGPVVLTITMELLEVWRNRTAAESKAKSEPAALSRVENAGGR